MKFKELLDELGSKMNEIKDFDVDELIEKIDNVCSTLYDMTTELEETKEELENFKTLIK